MSVRFFGSGDIKLAVSNYFESSEELTGKLVCFIDIDSGPIHNVAVCAEAINKLVDIDLIYMKPQVREFLTQTQPF